MSEADLDKYEIGLLRSIIGKLVETAGVTVKGRWMSFAYEEYGTIHPFTPEELEILGRVIEVTA